MEAFCKAPASHPSLQEVRKVTAAAAALLQDAGTDWRGKKAGDSNTKFLFKANI